MSIYVHKGPYNLSPAAELFTNDHGAYGPTTSIEKAPFLHGNSILRRSLKHLTYVMVK
jgi:hypothetical protein